MSMMTDQQDTREVPFTKSELGMILGALDLSHALQDVLGSPESLARCKELMAKVYELMLPEQDLSGADQAGRRVPGDVEAGDRDLGEGSE